MLKNCKQAHKNPIQLFFEAIKSNDANQIRKQYQPCRAELLKVSRYFNYDRNDHEDNISHAIEQMLKKIDIIKNARTWSISVMLNKSRNNYTQRKNRMNLLLKKVYAHQNFYEPPKVISCMNYDEILYSIHAALSKNEAEILVLYGEGFSSRELGEIFNLSHKTIINKVNISRRKVLAYLNFREAC